MNPDSDQEEAAIAWVPPTPKPNKGPQVPSDIPTPITTPQSNSSSPDPSSPTLLTPPSSAQHVPSLNLAIPHHAIVDSDPARCESPRSAAVTNQFSHLDLYALPSRAWVRHGEDSVDSGVDGGERTDEERNSPKRVRLTPETEEAGDVKDPDERLNTIRIAIPPRSGLSGPFSASAISDDARDTTLAALSLQRSASFRQASHDDPLDHHSQSADYPNNSQQANSTKRKRSITPPLPLSPATLEDRMNSMEDPDSITDDPSSLTWHESEITGHDINGPDDDGEGINGIGFKPTPSQAYQRAQHRKQQVQEWRAREAKDERERRLLHRVVKRHKESNLELRDVPLSAVDAAERNEVGINRDEHRHGTRRAVHFA